MRHQAPNFHFDFHGPLCGNRTKITDPRFIPRKPAQIRGIEQLLRREIRIDVEEQLGRAVGICVGLAISIWHNRQVRRDRPILRVQCGDRRLALRIRVLNRFGGTAPLRLGVGRVLPSAEPIQ